MCIHPLRKLLICPRDPNLFGFPNYPSGLQAMCKEEQEKEWLIDSVCSLHMTGRLEYLRDFRTISGGGHVTFGNNANGTIRGYSVLNMENFSIKWVAFVEGIKHNLISVRQLCEAGHRVEFDSEYCYIMASDQSTCFIKSKADGTMYPLDVWQPDTFQFNKSQPSWIKLWILFILFSSWGIENNLKYINKVYI